MDKVERMMAYEAGQLDGEQTRQLFQELIDSDEVWSLQGQYGRMANTLIAGGFCHRKGEKPAPRAKFREWDCRVVKREYSNGRVALELVDANDGGVVARATVNLPDDAIGDDEVFIKDYSWNAGMLAALQVAGVVGPELRRVTTGHVTVPVCKLLV